MRLFVALSVTLSESLFKSLHVGFSGRILELFRWTLLFEILLSRLVQFRFRWQRCAAYRLFSGLLTDLIYSPFFRSCAVACAMTVENRRAADDDPGHSRQDAETH